VDDRCFLPSLPACPFTSPCPSCIPYSILPLFLTRLKEELEKHGVQISAQAQNMQEEGTSSRKVVNPGTGWQRAETVREGGWVREHGRYWESRGMICG
jgi:hypothetical protein